jgi:hypothetical protein
MPLLVLVVGVNPKSVGKVLLLSRESFLGKFLSLKILQLLLPSGINPARKVFWGVDSVLDDAGIKGQWQTLFEHIQGTVLLFLIASEFQKLLKGGDIGIDVTILHMQGPYVAF